MEEEEDQLYDCSGFNKTTFRLFSLPQVNLYSSKL